MNQVWDPKRYEENTRFVSDLGMPVLDLLAPLKGERVLDLGCGDGALTEKLVEAGCDVVGVDASESFVQSAIERGLDARLADAESLVFDNEFDAVFSNAALHWMKNPDVVIEGVWKALKTGGRFVAEMGGEGNISLIRQTLHNVLSARGVDPLTVDPWYFPSAKEYAGKLKRAGFTVEYVDSFNRPTLLPGNIIGWLETMAGPFTGAIPESDCEIFLNEVQSDLHASLCDVKGAWTADYVRLRFSAVKPTQVRNH